MSINLSKGGGINLSKAAPGLSRLAIGLGWDANVNTREPAYDLDVSAFVLKANPNAGAKANLLVSDAHIIFYNNKTAPNGEVVHSGDNRTGSGEGDDETIMVDLSKMPAEAIEISFVQTIFEAKQRNQHLGEVKNSYIRVYNPDTKEEIARYRLEDEFKTETGVQVGSLVKKDDGWHFMAVGAGHHRDLGDFIAVYQGQ